MTRNDNDFTSVDFNSFQKFCRKLGAKNMKYDRFKADKCKTINVDLQNKDWNHNMSPSKRKKAIMKMAFLSIV